MTCSIRIVNDGNCAGDTVTIMAREHESAPWRHRQELGLGEVSERMSASGFVRLSSVHAGTSRPQVRVQAHSETPEEAGERVFEQYRSACGAITHDGQPMPEWRALGVRQKAGWIAAAGVPAHENPYTKAGGG